MNLSSWTHMIRELGEITGILSSARKSHSDALRNIASRFDRKIPVICGMGSSYFLAEFGLYFLKHIAGVPNAYSVESDELLSLLPNLWDNHVLVGLSQSGSSTETVKAIQEAKNRRAFTCSLHNKTDSMCQQIAHLSVFQNIGTEQSPVSTKYIAFQIVLLYKLAIFLWRINGSMDESEAEILLEKIDHLSKAVSHILDECNARIQELAEGCNWSKFIIVWNGIDAYCAQEIALKIRETTWLDATCDTEGILRHGGVNSVWPTISCILINGSPEIKRKLEERGSKVISFWSAKTNDVVIPQVNKFLDAWLTIIAWQLFVHRLSCHLNIDTDQKNW